MKKPCSYEFAQNFCLYRLPQYMIHMHTLGDCEFIFTQRKRPKHEISVLQINYPSN